MTERDQLGGNIRRTIQTLEVARRLLPVLVRDGELNQPMANRILSNYERQLEEQRAELDLLNGQYRLTHNHQPATA